MEIIEDTNEKFHIASQPSIISQAVSFGFFTFGFTMSFYSESLFWQLLYILGSFVIASSFLGHWQILIIEKVSNKLHFNVQNIYQKLFVRDKYLISETLNLEEMKQIKCNLSNGTISFYHNLTTISVYIGKPDKCEDMLAKFKSLLPIPMISQHGEQSAKILNILEDIRKEEQVETLNPADDSKELEIGDLPKTLSFDSLKEEDDGLSSDESFVKIDEKEFDECDPGATRCILKFVNDDDSNNQADEQRAGTNE